MQTYRRIYLSPLENTLKEQSYTAAKAGSEIIVLHNVKSILTDNSI